MADEMINIIVGNPTITSVLFQDSVSVRLKVLFWHKLAVVKGFGGWK